MGTPVGRLATGPPFLADGPGGSGPAARRPGAVTGRLLLAATPLGDARDASERLRSALAEADVVAAEDTRRLRALAAALGVNVPGRVVSHYDAVEAARLPGLLDEVRAGHTVLVVTDAGMPAVSDPGYRIVAAAAAEGLAVSCLPGPSAVTTALVVSGLPVERFCFDGFAPRRGGERRRWLETLRTEARAVVFFESPHRIAECLADAVAVLGPDRAGAVCRELTKTHEEVVRGPLAELAAWATGGVRGEVTVVLAGAGRPTAPSAESLVGLVQERVDDGERLKDAVAAVAAAAGVPKRELYAATVAARTS
ncbi:MAG TPA: 16S rRNA (cytidine(1402)-2'-O)-methyltransferase [Pseudonocardia sp.]|jgi:16S rRNA (cytidine1402-2'-O)-methyltransferase|nr:16S rRNA (cytidine(1402)-2'-O)-methyltransferase [Pseudonocardia sp.]